MDPSQLSEPGKGLDLPMKSNNNQSVRSETDAEIKYLFDLLKDGETDIELNDQYKNVILVLGNTGSGKSTFTQWIAGDDSKLVAKEVKEGSGEFIIEDNNRIGNSTIQSKTIFPEMVIDSESNAAYYDCPGFSDTRSMANDIATTFFIKKVLDFAESVKFIFTVSHPSVRKGVDRQDFMNLVRHVTDLVNDIDKFKKSVAVVATKVDNQYIKKGNRFVLVEDSITVGAIADFFQEVKEDLEERAKVSNVSVKDKKFYGKAIKFVDALLVKDDGQYSKIGIFRRPDEPGPLSNITLLKEGKNNIVRIIHRNLNYTAKNSNDFGYTVSEKSKNEINDVVEEINKTVWSSISNIAKTIQEYYGKTVKQISDRIQLFGTTDIDVHESEACIFSSTFSKGYNNTLNLMEDIKNVTNLEVLASKINNSLTNFDFSVPDGYILDIANQGKYFNFLQMVSGRELSTRQWAEIFKGTVAYFSESRNSIEMAVHHAVEKINGRIQMELDASAESIQEHFTDKMKLVAIQRLPAEFKKGQDILLNLLKGIKEAGTTKELFRSINDSAESLDISVPLDLALNIINQGQYFEFLQALSNMELKLASSAWYRPFEKLVEYLDESGKWYVFLNDLYFKFSGFEIQKDRCKYNVAALEDWGKIGKPQGIVITENTFGQFLNRTAQFNVKEYENIKDLPITELKIKELNSVLSFTLKHRVHVQCAEPYIFIKGNYIVLDTKADNMDIDGGCGDVRTALNSGRFKFVNIFALDTVFLDQDVTLRKLKLPVTVIAPKWEIVGNRLVDLNGVDGEPPNEGKAKDGVYSKQGGRGGDGEPGKPGGPGGVLFGISGETVNAEKLNITANGGRGSDGQNGGNGYSGKDGHSLELRSTPQPPNKPYQWIPGIKNTPCRNDYKQIMGYRCQLLFYDRIFSGWGDSLPPVTCKYKIFGVPGERGGDGGNGGKAGKGGNPGLVTLIQLSDQEQFRKEGVKGEDGKDGIGGRAGVGGRNGDDVTGVSFVGYDHIGWRWEDRIDNKRAPSGRKGSEGGNNLGLKEPEVAAVIEGKQTEIINEYKNYLIESLDDRFKNYYLIQFLNQLESNKNIKSLYNTLSLVEELENLEKQFHNLSKNVDFAPFYQSLLSRISEYALNPKDSENSSEYKKVLGYLYTATLGRKYDLKYSLESNLIIDISGYLDMVKNNVVILKDLQQVNNKADVINRQKENYKNKIDRKLEEAQSFVENQITPEINNISHEIDNKIDLLIDETLALEKQAKQEKEDLIRKKKELEEVLAYRGLFSCFKVIGQVISFMGPVGAAVGSVVGAVTSVTESLVLDNEQQKFEIPKSVLSNLKSLGDQIKSVRNRKIDYLNKVVNELSEELNKHPDNLNDISLKLVDIKDRLHKISEKRLSFKDVETLETELKQELNRKKEELKSQKDAIDVKTANALKVVEKCNRIVDFGSVLLDINSRLKDDEAKMDAINNAIEEAENKFEKLKQYEETINDTISPMLQDMEENLRDVANKLEKKSQVALDVTKWRVQSTLRDMKLQMQQFTRGFEVKDNLARCIEKLEEVMTTLINVYDRMQSYQEQQDLANYIADISSASASNIGISDPTLTDAVNRLDMLIRSNIVMKQYKSAVDAFKQWVFPFADHFLERQTLPSHIESEGSIENLVSKAVTQLEKIKSKVDEYKTSVRIKDKYIQSGEFNSRYFSTEPFFVWKNEAYNNTISELLSGKEVVLRADVRKSAADKDAIKFSSIEIYFKSINETLQSTINNTLKGFDIRVTHLGNSYYRYNDKIYLITSESQTVGYSFETNDVGEPVRKNKVYEKIKKGDLMLSPYTAWEIKVVNATHKISFQELEVFKDDIDLELSGYGSYVDRDISEFKLLNAEYKAIEMNSELANSNCKPKRDYYPFSSRRNGRSIDEIEGSSNFMTNKASVVTSPVNYVCNLLKLHVVSTVLNSVNLVFFGREESVKTVHKSGNHFKELDGGSKPHDRVTKNTVSSTAGKLSKMGEVISRGTSESAPSFETNDSLGAEKETESRLAKMYGINADDFGNSFLLLLSNRQQDIRIPQLDKVPEINSSLLLADLLARIITRMKYKVATHESLLSPRDVIARKINEEAMQNEEDFRGTLHEMLSDVENDQECSWISKIKGYAKSTLQFLGIAREEGIDDYMQDISNLFTP